MSEKIGEKNGKEDGKPVQRQRLKAETRRELIARLENPELSLHETAILLNVCKMTVRRYCDEGVLRHARTEGGQRRFYYQDIKDFIRQRSQARTQAKIQRVEAKKR